MFHPVAKRMRIAGLQPELGWSLKAPEKTLSANEAGDPAAARFLDLETVSAPPRHQVPVVNQVVRALGNPDVMNLSECTYRQGA